MKFFVISTEKKFKNFSYNVVIEHAKELSALINFFKNSKLMKMERRDNFMRTKGFERSSNREKVRQQFDLRVLKTVVAYFFR